MTKVNSKSNITLAIAAIIMVGFTLNVYAEVQNNGNKLIREKADKLSPACNMFGTTESKFIDRLKIRDEGLGNKQSKSDELVLAEMDRVDTKLVENRADWAVNRQKQYAMLESKTTTDSQKTAVEQFKKATEAAIATRISSVDKAISTYRTGLQNLRDQRKTSVTSAISSFKNSEEAAFNKAKLDCMDGASPATVRQTLKSEVASARDILRTDLQDTKIKSEAETLRMTKQAAIQKAITDFKTAMDTARAKLKEAFPKS